MAREKADYADYKISVFFHHISSNSCLFSKNIVKISSQSLNVLATLHLSRGEVDGMKWLEHRLKSSKLVPLQIVGEVLFGNQGEFWEQMTYRPWMGE